MFVDELEIVVSGGCGGNGVVSFRREKYVPLGGPDGGDGGHGGSVYLWADPSKHSFLDLRYRRLFKAPDGAHGWRKNQHGGRGADLFVPVPLGTIVRDEQKNILADLTLPGQRALVAKGGTGGKGNARFATAKRQAPRLAEKGLPGFERTLSLELKLMAQVGVVGFPNAGKSTLLGRISSARPKVASYPFTTLTPNLGVVKVGDEGSFIVADLPGLIEGAHQGAGLGHRFLRHVERNLLLLFLVDLSPEAHPAPLEAYRLLKKELVLFQKQLGGYPRVVVGSKLDLTGAAEQLDDLRRAVTEEEGSEAEVFGISAATGIGIDELVRFLYRTVVVIAEERASICEEAVIRAEQIETVPLSVEKTNDRFVIRGDGIEKMAAKTNFENEEALRRFQNYCRRIGLNKHLKKLGIKEGDTVIIGREELHYYD
ncbi:MAG TPA: GTPase ObgE [Candidatus Limnocylindrales bacterium]|nr:GTPase ObgE [Candidatus Limnocylindrales bacterium]